ncbi:MAG TPA: lysophospholipid acyltransferase family protein [Frankiaceae bacterium]|nr:lysophospholipid acyltransferase family protein [Frankiaceae bacterium]
MEPWYRFAVIVIRPLLWLLFKTDFRGSENLPRTGGVIVAVNHISYADPFATALFLHTNRRRPRFMAKHTLFKIPFVKQVLNGARQIPVYRNTSDAGLALRAAIEAVKAGECVVVYPEGTVTKDPAMWPMAAKTGVARLALATGAPVLPLGQWGAQEFLGKHKKFAAIPRKTLRLRCGPPVDLSRWAGAQPSVEVLRAMTTAVMNDVTMLVAEIRGEQPPATPFAPPRAIERARDDDSRRSA